MPSTLPPAARKRLAELDSCVRCLDAAIASVRDDLATLQGRQAALDERLAGELSRPAPKDAVTADLAIALASNPSTPIGTEAAGRLAKSRAATAQHTTAAEAITSVVGEAIEHVAGTISTKEAELERLTLDHARAWREFVQEAYSTVMGEFRTRWAALDTEILGPLLALAIEPFTPGTRSPIIGGDIPKIDPDSAVVLRTHSTRGVETEYLFSGSSRGGPPRSTHGVLDVFRASLAE